MCTVTVQARFLSGTAVKALFLVSAITAGAFSQTAKVPFTVNVAAKATATYLNAAVEKDIRIGKTDTLVIPLTLASSVSHNAQRQANAPATLAYSRGGVSLKLNPQQYDNAELSLFTVSGKRVLRKKALSSKAGEINVSKANITAGAYMLSVKGVNGNAFASKMTHNGGKLNINVAFAGGGNVLAAAGDYGVWNITVHADGYVDSVYQFSPDAGVNQTQNITLRQAPIIVLPSAIGCGRAGQIAAVDAYLAALQAGDYTTLPLAAGAKYSEYDNASKQDYRTGSITPTVNKFGEGLWAKKPIKVDFHRSLIDTVACASFTEVIINKDTAGGRTPYVNGVRLDISGNQISEVRVLVTTTGDWAFTASGYYRYSKEEEDKGGWGLLPVDQRLTRERLKTDAEAYFKYFRDKNAVVPWGIPCARLEGGAYTGDGSKSTCNVGVPDLTMDISTIWWLADVDYGMVVLFVYFGGADSHWFRILPTGYRYIHTLTAMKQSDYRAP